MKQLDILGTILLIIGNLALMISVVILISLDFYIDTFHIVALVTGIGGVIITIVSYIIALLVGVENESNNIPKV